MAMPDIPGRLSEILSLPLVLPAPMAGALAVLFVVLAVMAWRRAPTRLLLPLGGLILGALAVLTVIDRASLGQHAAERRGLLTRAIELTRSALSPGSPLACLVAGAGETVETACEKSVFASPQTVAMAVIYMDACLNILASAAVGKDDAELDRALASTRRAVELDRFGIIAHVLASRYGCTADKCAGFELVDDASALRANLKAQVFDQYVSRYAAGWNAPAQPSDKQLPAVSSLPPAPQATGAAAAGGGAPIAAIKPGETWDFPSAASIPPVSIMNAEPVPKKGADSAPHTTAENPPPKNAGVAAQSQSSASNGTAPTPLPLRPPNSAQQQAAPPAAR